MSIEDNRILQFSTTFTRITHHDFLRATGGKTSGVTNGWGYQLSFSGSVSPPSFWISEDQHAELAKEQQELYVTILRKKLNEMRLLPIVPDGATERQDVTLFQKVESLTEEHAEPLAEIMVPPGTHILREEEPVVETPETVDAPESEQVPETETPTAPEQEETPAPPNNPAKKSSKKPSKKKKD